MQKYTIKEALESLEAYGATFLVEPGPDGITKETIQQWCDDTANNFSPDEWPEIDLKWMHKNAEGLARYIGQQPESSDQGFISATNLLKLNDWLNKSNQYPSTWLEDDVMRHNKGIFLFYKRSAYPASGHYIMIDPSENTITVGEYEGAYANIGDACFNTSVSISGTFSELFELCKNLKG